MSVYEHRVSPISSLLTLPLPHGFVRTAQSLRFTPHPYTSLLPVCPLVLHPGLSVHSIHYKTRPPSQKPAVEKFLTVICGEWKELSNGWCRGWGDGLGARSSAHRHIPHTTVPFTPATLRSFHFPTLHPPPSHSFPPFNHSTAPCASGLFVTLTTLTTESLRKVSLCTVWDGMSKASVRPGWEQ